MKAQSKLTDERKLALNELAERISEIAKSEDEHCQSEDGCVAEFVRSYFYGDARIDDFYFDRIDDEQLAVDLKAFATAKGVAAQSYLFSHDESGQFQTYFSVWQVIKGVK